MLTTLLAALALAAPALAEPEKQVVVRTELFTRDQHTLVERLGGTPWSCRAGLGEGDWQVPASAVDALRKAGLACTVIVTDVDELVAGEGRRLADAIAAPAPEGIQNFYSDYRDYASIVAHITAMAAAHPQHITILSAGTTLQGRDLPVMRFALPGSPANKPALFINGTQHAREWLSPMTVVYVADQIAAGIGADPAVDAMLSDYTIYIAPIVNPDGYAYTWTPGTTQNPFPNRLWRKNRRPNSNGSFGVDLNRNWGYFWGLNAGSSGSQSNETYRGPSAFSERETQAFRDFTSARPEILAHIDYHTYGPYILSPWGYTSVPPADEIFYRGLNQTMKDAVIAATGRVYRIGPSNTTLYATSGSIKDWMLGARAIPAQTIELQGGDGTPIPGTAPQQFYTGFVASPSQIVPSGVEGWAAFRAWVARVSQSSIRFKFDPPLPHLLVPNAPTPVSMTIQGLDGPLAATAPRLHYRIGREGAYTTITMNFDAGKWFGALPAAPCGAYVQAYFEADLAGSPNHRWPTTGADGPAQFRTGTGIQTQCAPCRADVTRDGFATGADFDMFISAFFGEDRDPQGTLIADVATAGGSIATSPPDGLLSGEDFDAFVMAFFDGCP